MKRLMIVLTVFCGLSVTAYSQNMADASVTANVVEPITVSTTGGGSNTEVSMVAITFSGNIYVNTIPSPKQKNQTSGSDAFPFRTGVYTMVTFQMTGGSIRDGRSMFTITLPKKDDLSVELDGKTYRVTSFVADEQSLNPRSGMIAGVYISVSSDFVTVNYN